jgi:hypothetical protein
MRKVIYSACSFSILVLSATLLIAAQTQQPAQTPSSEDVPVTDGASGGCTIDFNVTDSEGKPVYAARIDVHLAYGFAGAHKLDMGVYTNAQGKARFTGIPLKVRKPPIEFRAKKGDLIGLATMDPMVDCHAKHDVVLAKEKLAAP